MSVKLPDEAREAFAADEHRQFSTSTGDEITCRCCGEKYKRGGWNFYDLCNPCFIQFDVQKMRGRLGRMGLATLFGIAPHKATDTEDSDEFIKSGKCTHKA